MEKYYIIKNKWFIFKYLLLFILKKKNYSICNKCAKSTIIINVKNKRVFCINRKIFKLLNNKYNWRNNNEFKNVNCKK